MRTRTGAHTSMGMHMGMQGRTKRAYAPGQQRSPDGVQVCLDAVPLAVHALGQVAHELQVGQAAHLCARTGQGEGFARLRAQLGQVRGCGCMLPQEGYFGAAASFRGREGAGVGGLFAEADYQDVCLVGRQGAGTGHAAARS